MIFRIKHRHLVALLVAVAGAFAAWQLGGWRTAFRHELPLASVLGWGIGGGVGALVINMALHETLKRCARERYLRAFRRHADAVLGPMRWPEYLAGGLMAGVAEEPLFRGVALPAAASLTGSVPFGIAAAALVFAACHWLRRELWPFWLWALWEGVLFGLLMAATGTVLVPMIAHAVHDVVAYRAFHTLVRVQNVGA